MFTLKENSLDSIYSFLGIVVMPTSAIAVSLFTSYFTEDVTIARGIIMLTLFVFIVVVAFLIATNQYNKRTIEGKLRAEREESNKRVNEQKGQIERLEQDIREHTKGLWREFSPLNTYRKNELLLSVFERFSESYSSVVSVQLYNYFEQRGSQTTFIKIKHILGHVMERKNLNSIQQHYFEIPTELLTKFEDAIYNYRGRGENKDEALLQIYAEIVNELEDLQPTKVEVEHAIKFSFLILIQDIFHEDSPHMKGKISIIKNEKVENELFQLLRTGILRGILFDKMFYRFNYIKTNGSVNEKAERTYLTIKSGKTNGKQSILVITFDNEGKDVNVLDLGSKLYRLLIENGFES